MRVRQEPNILISYKEYHFMSGAYTSKKVTVQVSWPIFVPKILDEKDGCGPNKIIKKWKGVSHKSCPL